VPPARGSVAASHVVVVSLSMCHTRVLVERPSGSRWSGFHAPQADKISALPETRENAPWPVRDPRVCGDRWRSLEIHPVCRLFPLWTLSSQASVLEGQFLPREDVEGEMRLKKTGSVLHPANWSRNIHSHAAALCLRAGSKATRSTTRT